MTRVLFRCQATDISVTLPHMSSRWPSLAQVVGRNCQRIRAENGLTQNDLARYGREVGLRWNAAKVGDFEKGRSTPTFATVLAVTLALQMAIDDVATRRASSPTSPEVKLADLVGNLHGFVAVNDGLDVAVTELAAVCSGDTFEVGGPGISNRPVSRADERIGATAKAELTEDIRAVLQRSGLPEDRLAQRLRISAARLATESFRLWQNTFSEERDRRAGPGANQQKRGRVSRELRAQLEEEIADGDD
jgi:transcriptional regulator with XRE-family HTH domain